MPKQSHESNSGWQTSSARSGCDNSNWQAGHPARVVPVLEWAQRKTEMWDRTWQTFRIGKSMVVMESVFRLNRNRLLAQLGVYKGLSCTWGERRSETVTPRRACAIPQCQHIPYFESFLSTNSERLDDIDASLQCQRREQTKQAHIGCWSCEDARWVASIWDCAAAWVVKLVQHFIFITSSFLNFVILPLCSFSKACLDWSNPAWIWLRAAIVAFKVSKKKRPPLLLRSS